MNFVYNITDTKIVCIAKYAGRTVRGVAKCHPEDSFDLEKGRELARCRCEHKIAEKKLKRANMLTLTAFNNLHVANQEVSQATKYQDDALANLLETRAALASIEKSLS